MHVLGEGTATYTGRPLRKGHLTRKLHGREQATWRPAGLESSAGPALVLSGVTWMTSLVFVEGPGQEPLSPLCDLTWAYPRKSDVRPRLEAQQLPSKDRRRILGLQGWVHLTGGAGTGPEDKWGFPVRSVPGRER